MDTFRIHQSLPSFLLVSLFFFLILSSSSAQDDCSPIPLDCGGGKFPLNISYPFWAKGRPEYCCHPGEEFKILCNETDKSAEIEIQLRKYHVREIDYSKQTTIIVDKDYFGNNDNSNSCLRPSSNISLDLNFFQLPKEHLNLTFVYNCSSLDKNLPYFKSLDCPSNFTPPSDDFFSIEPLTSVEEQLRGCPIIEIPILKKTWDWHFEDSWIDALAEGFEISWSKIDPDHHCRECHESNSHCGLIMSKTSPQLQHTCYCNGTRPPHLATCHLYQPPAHLPAQGHNKAKKKIVIGAAAGVCILLLTCSSFFTICIIRKSSSDNSIFYWKKKSNVEVFLENYGALVPKRYRYSELKKIANYFNDNLGQGGYGSVFKGKLNDGRLVAVKVLNNSKGSNGGDFINEVASIGRTYHVNVVTLLGFCSEGSKRALVYEFMSKGSLEKFIFSDKRGGRHFLDSQKLFEIAVGIARGLDYLHRGCSTRILNFDIKPHNILLDDNFCPKISDFGLAKLCPQQESTVSMLDARGTVGYTAPEVFCRNIGGVSHKSDVYSYGMMVLEMIGGRKNIDAKVENTSEVYFPHWVYKHIEVKESLEVLGFGTQAEEEIARKMVVVGLWCIQTNPTNRPSMSRVVEMLEGSLGSLQMPPKPYLSSPSRPCSSTT